MDYPIEELKKLILDLYSFFNKKLNLNKHIKIILKQNKKNASNPLGKTGSYDKNNNIIELYITGRHPKDILRSAAHEIFHVFQDCNDEINNSSKKNINFKKIEEEAYKNGNILFREWEYNKKKEKDYVNYT